MGIRPISSSSAPGLGYAQPQQAAPGERRTVTADPSVLSSLTGADREVIAAMFGADLLSTGRDGDGAQVGVPPFVRVLIEDRTSGRLPVGSEVTSSYLEAIWDQQTTAADLSAANSPLTDRSLADALGFLVRRQQGARVDIRA